MGSVTVTTQEDGVSAIHAKLKGVGKRTLSRISRQMAEEGVSLIQLGFSTGTDPYGAAWKALALRDGQPLRDTGRLMGSTKVIYSDESLFSVAVTGPFADVHQNGAVIRAKNAKALAMRGGPRGVLFRKSATIPARKMVPDDGLPSAWADAFVEVYSEVMAAILA